MSAWSPATEASAFPANLPVGTVHFTAANVPEVVPAAMLDRLEIVRIFDYGLAASSRPRRRPPAGTARPLMARADQAPGIRPRATLGRRLDISARHAFPATCTMVLMLLTETPFGITDQAALLPAVTLACVYFWSLFRPAAMPPPVVFLIGLLLDLLGYLPLGVGVLTLLVVHGLALRWRGVLTRQGFLSVWLVFAGFAAGAAALGWVLTSLLSFRLLPVGPALFQATLTAALYPALAILFTRAHRTVADPERV